VPGMVLGLGYIFFFNAPRNPLNFLYGTMAILVLSTIIHYYTSSHLTAVTALKALDNEFEAVSASLKVPFYKTFFRVTVPVCLPAILVLSTIIHYYTSSHLTAVTALKALDNEFEAVSASLKVPFYKTFLRVTAPVCLPAILDIARYLFINAMVTLSAVIFLYSPDTKLASIAIVNLDEAGEIGPAAAMATLIVATSTVVCIVYALLTRVLLRRTQAWRAPTNEV
jgi:ABC-type Fe3+ transport system permease subunit